MHEKSLTKDVTQLEIVVLSVYLLDGGLKNVDTEDIAVRCHELLPGMFAWRKYPTQINLELVRVALSDAKKKSYGSLLQGSGREGWRLTTAGLAWCESRGRELLQTKIEFNTTRRQAGSVDSRRLDRERNRLLNSKAWASWKRERVVPLAEARELFRIDGYSTPTMSEAKIVRFQSMFGEDSSISEFLIHVGGLITNYEGAK